MRSAHYFQDRYRELTVLGEGERLGLTVGRCNCTQLLPLPVLTWSQVRAPAGLFPTP